MEAPKCPVCHDVMTMPIYQCQTGHSVCFSCTKKLKPAICPLCRQVMTQTRNWQLEDLVSSIGLPCPNKFAGCTMKISSKSKEEHLKECIFRTIQCPIGQACGTCSWTGHRSTLPNHFKERHVHNYIKKPKTNSLEICVGNVSVSVDCRHLYLIQDDKNLFILSFKIDTIKRQAYWLVQYMGTKAAAGQNIYEIHLTSQQRENRKVIFVDYCFSDSIDANIIIRDSKCASLPLDMVSHFFNNSKVTFSCFIKRNQYNRGPANNPNAAHSNTQQGSRSNSCTRNQQDHQNQLPFLKNKSKSNLNYNKKPQS